MMGSRYRNIVAGLALGGASLFLTFHLRNLVGLDPSVIMRALKAAGFALVVPGLIMAILVGNVHAFRLSLVATVNFLFWFGFGSLFASDGPVTACTAAWQPGARLAMFFCRHCSEAAPPGAMLEQCAM